MVKTEKLFSKIIMIVFLVLIVLGFTIPGFINNPNPGAAQSKVEPRLCKSDADCYLTCDNQPWRVLCLQNLCQQNECGESYFEYASEQLITFQLEIIINAINAANNLTAGKISLIERAHFQDFFVKFSEDDQVKIYSPRLSLNVVLSKAGMVLAGNCLKIGPASYCQDEANSLTILVNGKEIASPEIYIPNEGDEIKISYQPSE